MIEVEIRAKIKDLKKVQNNLLTLGATFVKRENQIDKIFGREKDLDKNRKIIEGCFSARIRKKGSSASVELKEINRQGSGLEFSSPVNTIRDGVNFLTKLDYKEAFTISKTREIYVYKDFEISLDDVDKLGNYIEIEYLSKSGINKESALRRCKQLLKKFDPSAKIEPKKYGDLMQELINNKKTKNIDQTEDLVRLFSEFEKLKKIQRFKDSAKMLDKESSADHSWRLALFVFLLSKDSKIDVDCNKVMLMALFHNLYEIYSDNVDYKLIAMGKVKIKNKIKFEKLAINRISRLKPNATAKEISDLIAEYYEGESKEAKYLQALSKIETLDHLVNCGYESYDDPKLIATYADKAVGNTPELLPVLKEIKKRLKIEFQKGNIAWEKSFNT